MPRCEPGDANRSGISACAQGDVREWLGTGCHGRSNSRLRSMRDESNCGSPNRGEQLHLRRQVGCSLIGEQGSNRQPNECVQRVPDQVQAGDFISDELNSEHRSAGADHPPITKSLEPRRQNRPMHMDEQAQRQNSRVNIEAGRKTCSYDERGDIGGSKNSHAELAGVKTAMRTAPLDEERRCRPRAALSLKRVSANLPSMSAPASSIHAIAITVTLIMRSLPMHPWTRWPGPSSRSPHPVSADPVVVSVRPHKARAGRYPDRAPDPRRWRSDAHTRIERESAMLTPRYRQNRRQDQCRCCNSKLMHRLLPLQDTCKYLDEALSGQGQRRFHRPEHIRSVVDLAP